VTFFRRRNKGDSHQNLRGNPVKAAQMLAEIAHSLGL